MNILFFGGHYWDRGAWFRKQQFALRLSRKGHKVFYVEESKSIIRKSRGDKNDFFNTIYQKINDNLFIITPSCLFPYPSNYFTRNTYNIKLLFDIERILKYENVRNYILWTNKIEISTRFHKINKTKILDICDDLPLYHKLGGNEKEYKSTSRFFELAFKLADVPIVSAYKLKEKYNYLTKKDVIVIPNGHNINLDEIKNYTLPEDIKNIPPPIIGFLGTLFHFIDDELLEYLIKSRPNYNFVFVGDVDSSFPTYKIQNYSNVFIIGRKPKESIPSYIKYFDVCLNPFKVHEVNDSVNPVKVFEYLAMKKPVISTKMYSLTKEKIASYIDFSEDKKTF